MASKFGMWWQKIKQHRGAIVVVAIVLVVVIVLIVVGYRFNWTGFTGKTLWDWLQLLIIPLVLAVGALLFNLATTRTEQKIASDKQREDLLQTYLDRMSELLLEKQLHSPASPYEICNVTRDEVRNVARVRTITILFQLDARRIGYVFAFLREAGLMSTTAESIVSLKQANLTRINFSQAEIAEVDLRGTILYGANLEEASLSGATLSGADLNEATLSGAFLYEADLSGARLREADLSGAFLWKADLSSAHLSGADLSRATLWEADLSSAKLGEATLSKAHLMKADLSEADLSEADLRGADLSEADLRGADLRGADLRGANLDKTILKGARYNTEEILGRTTPTQWPQGFDPKAAGAIEDNTSP